MIKKRLVLTFLTCLSLVGCYGVAPPEESRVAYFGAPPLDYMDQIKAHMGAKLFDPYSAMYECAIPCQAATVTPLWIGEHQFGWLYNCTVNAKNRFGGYVGKQLHQFFFDSNGKLVVTSKGSRCV